MPDESGKLVQQAGVGGLRKDAAGRSVDYLDCIDEIVNELFLGEGVGRKSEIGQLGKQSFREPNSASLADAGRPNEGYKEIGKEWLTLD